MNAEAEVEDDDAGGRNPTGKGGGGGGGRELFGEGSMLLPAPDVALKRKFFFPSLLEIRKPLHANFMKEFNLHFVLTGR